jgi:trehalose-6-phosphate synthase
MGTFQHLTGSRSCTGIIILSFEELCALYQAADIALITPLRDGMNLVAKEYIASCIDKGV